MQSWVPDLLQWIAYDMGHEKQHKEKLLQLALVTHGDTSLITPKLEELNSSVGRSTDVLMGPSWPTEFKHHYTAVYMNSVINYPNVKPTVVIDTEIEHDR